MNLLNNTELRLLCNDLLLNGNQLTSRHDSELRRMSRQLDERLGRTSEDLSEEDLMLLSWMCLNSGRTQNLRQLNELRRNS
jgi:hypothetical protein